MMAGSEEMKHKYLTPVARGEAMFSYCLSEPDAGSDAAGIKTTATRTDGGGYVLNGVKRWITNAGVSEYYTVLAGTDPTSRRGRVSAFVGGKSDGGVSLAASETQE